MGQQTQTKLSQYSEYIAWGGTMTMEEWEKDGRYDKSLESGFIDEGKREDVEALFNQLTNPQL